MLTIKAEIEKGKVRNDGTYNVRIRFTKDRAVKPLGSRNRSLGREWFFLFDQLRRQRKKSNKKEPSPTVTPHFLIIIYTPFTNKADRITLLISYTYQTIP